MYLIILISYFILSKFHGMKFHFTKRLKLLPLLKKAEKFALLSKSGKFSIFFRVKFIPKEINLTSFLE